MAMALRRDGIEDFTVFERGTDLGGVWQANHYPGAACDVPSYLYSYSHEQRRDWSRPCSPQAGDPRTTCTQTADKHGVSAEIRTRHRDRVRRLRRGQRQLAPDGPRPGDEHEADGAGGGVRPAQPAQAGRRFPAVEEFAGHEFHSAEWDHDYDLAGKRVAVVGTGASAVQFVPPGGRAGGPAWTSTSARAPCMLPRSNDAVPAWAAGGCSRSVPGLQALRRRYGMLAFMESTILGFIAVPPLALAAQRVVARRSCATQLRDPERAPQGCGPTTRSAASAMLFSSRLPAGAAAPQRGGRDRRDRAHHAGRRGGRRARAPGGLHRLGHRLQAPATSCCRCSVAGRGRARAPGHAGPMAPRRTSGSRSPGSRTCSCSTGPTPTWAWARSSR